MSAFDEWRKKNSAGIVRPTPQSGSSFADWADNNSITGNGTAFKTYLDARGQNREVLQQQHDERLIQSELKGINDLSQHMEGGENLGLQDKVNKNDINGLRDYRQELERRSQPSNIEKGGNLIGGLAEGLLSFPMKAATVLQEWTGQRADSEKRIYRDSERIDEGINELMSEGKISPEEGKSLKNANSGDRQRELQEFLAGSDFAGFDSSAGNRARIAGGVAAEGALDIATFGVGKAAFGAKAGVEAALKAARTGDEAVRLYKLADIYKSGAVGQAAMTAAEKRAATIATTTFGRRATKYGLSIEQTAKLAEQNSGRLSAQIVDKFKDSKMGIDNYLKLNRVTGGRVPGLIGNSGVRTAGKIGRGATVGGSLGAGFGAAESLQGDDFTAEEFKEKTLKGAMFGAGLGGGLSAVGPAIGGAARGAGAAGRASLTGINKTASGRKLTSKVGNSLDKFNYDILDRFNPIVKVISEAEKRMGKEWKAGRNLVDLIRVHSGAGGRAGLIIADDVLPVFSKLDDVYAKKYGVTKGEYSKALNEYGYGGKDIARHRTGDGVITDVQLKQAKANQTAALKKFSKKDLDAGVKANNKIANETLDIMADAGILSKASVRSMKKDKNYFAKTEVIQDYADEIDTLLTTAKKNPRNRELVRQRKGRADDTTLATFEEAQVQQIMVREQILATQKIGESLYNLGNEEMVKVLSKDSKAVPKGWKEINLYKKGGQEIRMAMPNDLAESLANLSTAHAGEVTSAMGKVGRVLRASVTTLRPVFTLMKNPIRDFRNLLVNAEEVKLQDSVKAWRDGFMESMTGREGYKAYTKAGGGQSGLVYSIANQKSASKIVKQYHSGSLKTAIRKPLDIYNKIGEAIENAPRIAEFKAGKGKGLTDLQAAVKGRQVTIDFAQGGALVKQANLWVPFLNARVQGTRRMVQAFKKNPQKAMGVYAMTTALPMAVTLHNNITNHKAIWEDIPDYVKDENFIWIWGDGVDEQGNPTQAFKLPKAELDKILGTPIEQAIISALDGNPKSLQGTILHTLSEASPIDFEDDGGFSLEAMMKSLPPAIKGPYEWVNNKNLLTGEDIVKHDQVGAPGPEQTHDGVNRIAQGISNVTNASAVKIDQLLKSFVGPQADFASSGGFEAVKDFQRQVDVRGGATTNDFFDRYLRLKDVKAWRQDQIKEAREAGDFNKADRIKREYYEQVEDAFDPFFEEHAASLLTDDFDYNKYINYLKL